MTAKNFQNLSLRFTFSHLSAFPDGTELRTEHQSFQVFCTKNFKINIVSTILNRNFLVRFPKKFGKLDSNLLGNFRNFVRMESFVHGEVNWDFNNHNSLFLITDFVLWDSSGESNIISLSERADYN